jgi:hypothetical protein
MNSDLYKKYDDTAFRGDGFYTAYVKMFAGERLSKVILKRVGWSLFRGYRYLICAVLTPEEYPIVERYSWRKPSPSEPEPVHEFYVYSRELIDLAPRETVNLSD